MKRLVSTIDLSKREWLLYRKKFGLTGTDISSILNMNPYRSAFDVYQDKTTDEFDESDNEAMKQGRELEQYVVKRFCEETGLKVRRANGIYYNEQYPFMLADFDRLVVGEKAGLECKTVSPYSADQWADGRTPQHYLLQVQHYLAVSGYDCWYIAALVFGTEFIIRKIERDEELIRNLITMEERFWTHNIIGRNIPEPDGSENYSEVLKKRYFNSRKDKEIRLFGVEEDLRRREELNGLLGKLEKEKKIIEQKIQLQLGKSDAVYAEAGQYRIAWTPTITNRIDTARLKEEKPEIYQSYLKESYGKRFTVKEIRKEAA